MSATESVPDIGLDWLLERTRQDGECLAWCLLALQGRYPAATVCGTRWYVRRLLWRITRGRPVPKGCDICMSCGNDLCVHPDHLEARADSRRERGGPTPIARRIRIALAMRSRSTLTAEDVRVIRNSEGSCEDVAALFGIGKSHVRGIRSGRLWRDLSSPFAGLGAQ